MCVPVQRTHACITQRCQSNTAAMRLRGEHPTAMHMQTNYEDTHHTYSCCLFSIAFFFECITFVVAIDWFFCLLMCECVVLQLCSRIVAAAIRLHCRKLCSNRIELEISVCTSLEKLIARPITIKEKKKNKHRACEHIHDICILPFAIWHE